MASVMKFSLGKNLLTITAGLLIISGTLNTVTAGTEVRFGVIADVQYRDFGSNQTKKHYKESIQKLDKAVRQLNNENLDFVMVLGDMKDDGCRTSDLDVVFNKNLSTGSKLDYSRYGFADISAPSYFTVGNHDLCEYVDTDVTSLLKGEVSPVTPLVRSSYDADLSFAYSFTIPGKDHFLGIVLDGTELSRHRYSANENQTVDSLYNLARANPLFSGSYNWNGAISQQQLQALDNLLLNASKDGKNVVVFSHFPVWPEDQHNLWNYKEVLETIEKHSCVVAYVNGHNHGGDDGYRGNTSYVSVKAMLSSSSSAAYGIMTLNDKYLLEEGFDSEPNRVIKQKNKVVLNNKNLY